VAKSARHAKENAAVAIFNGRTVLESQSISRRNVLGSLLGLSILPKHGFAAWRELSLNDAESGFLDENNTLRTNRIKSFCIDFNWARNGVFAAPGVWADADPEEHVEWYHAAGANTIQTFCVSCNGYAWYKGGKIPPQPNLKHSFLAEVCRHGHDRGQLVMGYFCIGANVRWQKLHPEECSDSQSSHTIVFTKQYLEYLDVAITEALSATSIDGFMVDWLWTPSGPTQWLSCEKQMYEEFFGKVFPGKEKISPDEELIFKRRSIERCWSTIHLAAKRHRPQTIVWLSCNNPADPTIRESKTFLEVDWLMNENPDSKTWPNRVGNGRQTKLLQCVVGWGDKDDAPAIIQHPPLDIRDFYGFAPPEIGSLPKPVADYLKKPINSFQGNDRNIAALVRYFNNLPFTFVKG
jgi:hypothetical protein